MLWRTHRAGGQCLGTAAAYGDTCSKGLQSAWALCRPLWPRNMWVGSWGRQRCQGRAGGDRYGKSCLEARVCAGGCNTRCILSHPNPPRHPHSWFSVACQLIRQAALAAVTLSPASTALPSPNSRPGPHSCTCIRTLPALERQDKESDTDGDRVAPHTPRILPLAPRRRA